MDRIELAIEGMSCHHCVAAVRAAMERIWGVVAEDVGVGFARVQYDSARRTPGELVAAIRAAGYAAEVREQ